VTSCGWYSVQQALEAGARFLLASGMRLKPHELIKTGQQKSVMTQFFNRGRWLDLHFVDHLLRRGVLQTEGMRGRHKDSSQSFRVAAARRIQLQTPRTPATLFVGFEQSIAEIAKLVAFSTLQRTLGGLSQEYRVVRFVQPFGAVQRKKLRRAGPSRGYGTEQDAIGIERGKPRYLGSTHMRIMQNDDGLRFQPVPPRFRHAFLESLQCLEP